MLSFADSKATVEVEGCRDMLFQANPGDYVLAGANPRGAHPPPYFD